MITFNDKNKANEDHLKKTLKNTGTGESKKF